jgi:uncharacterized protein
MPTETGYRELRVLGEKIAPGSSVQLNMSLAKLFSRTPVDVPVFVNRAKEEGPFFVLMAGIHGDEINGVEIVRRLIEEGCHKPNRGAIICIPVCNIFGFINQTRALPDGRDLNRMFPGSEDGSLASRLAYLLVNDVLEHVDLGIDFHTGEANRFNYPQVRCMIDDEKNLQLASVFNAPFVVGTRLRDKSLRKIAYNRGKTLLLYEGGESSRFDEEVIEVGVAGAKRVLKYLGMVNEAEDPPRQSVVLQKTTWVRARVSGMFRARVKNGVYVRKRQRLGIITDPYGDFERSVLSPFSGHIICVNYQPLVNQGEALFNIGHG